MKTPRLFALSLCFLALSLTVSDVSFAFSQNIQDGLDPYYDSNGAFKEKDGTKIAGNIKLNDIDKIIYNFTDSSVPPQYHRSYQLTLTMNYIKIVVDSYGEILLRKLIKFNRKNFHRLLKNFERYKITKKDEDINNGCTGGTGETITIFNGKRKLFDGYIYHCGGNHYGNLDGSYQLYFKSITKIVKNLDTLIDSTR